MLGGGEAAKLAHVLFRAFPQIGEGLEIRLIAGEGAFDPLQDVLVETAHLRDARLEDLEAVTGAENTRRRHARERGELPTGHAHLQGEAKQAVVL